MLTPTWVQIILRIIGANWLVSAVYISFSSLETGSKFFETRWPRITFFALGLDHIANIYSIPVAIF